VNNKLERGADSMQLRIIFIPPQNGKLKFIKALEVL
jgi:hypothetical protein